MRIKTVRQLDETDCGAACIATVLKYYGRSVPIRKIRKEAGTDKIGTSGFGIIKAAQKYGLSCKGFSSPDKSKIVKIPLPAIFHTQQGADHYMVVYKVSNKNVFVCDPAIGTRKIDHEEFNKIWTGVFFILFPLEEFKKGREETGLALTFLSLLRPYKGLIIKIFLASVLLSFFGIFISFYFRFIIDEVLYSQIKSTLNLCSLCYLLVIIFQAILVFCRNQIILYLGAKIDVRLVSSFFCHLLHLPLDYFSSRKTGEILSRINDANIVRNAISSATISVVLDAFLLVFGGFFLVKMGSSLLPVAIVPVLISAGIVYMFSKKLKFKIRERAIIEADKNATMYESINGIATLKGLSTEDLAFERTEEKIVESATKTVELGQLNNIQHSMQEIVSGAGKLALYWLGSFLIFDGKITLGQLISFVTLSGFFLDPLRRLLTMQLYFQEVWMSAQRLFDVIDMEEENNNAEEKNTDLDLYGDIEFKNVSFAYGTRGFAVEDVSLSIPAGKKVAFVGMSGSGKSTLLKLLMKFYKNMSGKILVNGIDIAEIQTDYYRNQIGYVPQESLLFSGTIKDNIAWGASDADMSQIFEAASSSRSVDFIEHLPEKFNTYVGEQGATLSGGERQRIAIARILMRNPKIIILDEATASLDSISEKLIMNTIYNTIQNKSVIMVAHRLSTVKNCDKIFVFNSGKLVEEGNHTELLQKKGFYYQLWSAQNDGIEAVSA